MTRVLIRVDADISDEMAGAFPRLLKQTQRTTTTLTGDLVDQQELQGVLNLLSWLGGRRDRGRHDSRLSPGSSWMRAGRPDRRRRVRASSAFGGPCETPDLRAAGGRGAEVHPLPHHGAVLADARGAAVGPQPPHGRDGRHHRDRDLRARLQLAAAEHAARRSPRSSSSTATTPPSSASATRCRCGRPAPSARSTTGRTPAAASSTSTGSSAARPTSGTRRSTRTPRRSSRGARPRRATTSWTT